MQFTTAIRITGKVQGVFYRQSTKEKAIALGLTGEVQNLEDGSVYIRATGTKDQLDQLIAWCKQGPPRAKVESVVNEELPLQKFTSFNIIRH